MLQKEKPSIKSLLFIFEDQGKFNLICLLENISSVASEGQY